MLKVVAISDTHNVPLSELDLPEADLLVHAGDSTLRGREKELEAFNRELGSVKGKYKYGVVIIAGNHDFMFQDNPSYARKIITNAHYLQDSEVVIDGKRIYGSPWQPVFHNWAFNLPKDGEQLKKRWAAIPEGTDLLITHGPPYGIGDRVDRILYDGEDPHVGCKLLAKRVLEVSPKVHVFGHIHEARGSWQLQKTLYINATTCDLRYRPVNAAYEFEI